MKIAITGANGFIGSSLTRYLIKKGHDVTALVRKTAKVNLLPVKSRIVEIDYQNPVSIHETFNGQEIVIHSAALTRAVNWDEMKEINVKLTEKVVNSVNESTSVKQLVFLSSQAAAGMGLPGKPKTEEDNPTPLTWYGKSKLLAEETVKSKSQKEWTIVRPVSVYGPGDKDFLETFRLLKNHVSVSLGLKDKYISLIYVEELNRFIEKCLVNSKAYKQVFFASDGQTYSHKMFADALQNAIHTYSLHISIPDILGFSAAALGEIWNKIHPKSLIVNLQKFRELRGRYWTVSIDKARQLLDFNPEPNLSNNLHRTWLWYKEQGWL